MSAFVAETDHSEIGGSVTLEFWHIALIGLYLAIAAVCCVETMSENGRARRSRDGWYAAGLVLCLFWPLLLAGLLALCLYDRVRRRRY